MQGLLYQLIYIQKYRNNFVEYHIVPMINVDGVVAGNFRTSLYGKDLNRQYFSTNQNEMSMYPEISYIQELHQQHNYSTVLDIHSHSSKKNIFVYGVSSQKVRRDYLEGRILSQQMKITQDKYMKDNEKPFNQSQSIYKLSKDKRNCCRGYFYEVGVIQSYTIECSNMGYVWVDEHKNQVDMYFGQNRSVITNFAISVLGQAINRMVEREIRFRTKLKHTQIQFKQNSSNRNSNQIKNSSGSGSFLKMLGVKVGVSNQQNNEKLVEILQQYSDSFYDQLFKDDISQIDLGLVEDENQENSDSEDEKHDMDQEQYQILRINYIKSQKQINNNFHSFISDLVSEENKDKNQKVAKKPPVKKKIVVKQLPKTINKPRNDIISKQRIFIDQLIKKQKESKEQYEEQMKKQKMLEEQHKQKQKEYNLQLIKNIQQQDDVFDDSRKRSITLIRPSCKNLLESRNMRFIEQEDKKKKRQEEFIKHIYRFNTYYSLEKDKNRNKDKSSDKDKKYNNTYCSFEYQKAKNDSLNQMMQQKIVCKKNVAVKLNRILNQSLSVKSMGSLMNIQLDGSNISVNNKIQKIESILNKDTQQL